MKVRKIAALAVGAAMVGATLGYASAAMPEKEFFVKDGEPNVKIVVGANAPSTMDVVSAADIAVALGTLLYTEKEVEAEATAVVVKEDTAYDPIDIPVFDMHYFKSRDEGSSSWVGEGINDGDYDDLEGKAYWWNGSYGTQIYWDSANFIPLTYESFDDSVWGDDPPTLTYTELEDAGWALYPYDLITQDDAISGGYNITMKEWGELYYNPLYIYIDDAGYVDLVKEVSEEYTNPDTDYEYTYKFDSGYIYDYELTINKIQFDKDEWEKLMDKHDDEPIPPKDISLVIPEGEVQIYMNFALYGWEYPTYGSAENPRYYRWVDDMGGYTDDVVTLRPGITIGDIITLPGIADTPVKIVKIDSKIGTTGKTYAIVYGESYGTEFLKQGETYTFGDYKVTVLDIDVYDDKALLQVEGPEGTELVILDADTDPEKTLFDGGLYLKLKSTFVGIEGNLIAEVEIASDLKGIEQDDTDFAPGWEIHFDIVTNSTWDFDGDGENDPYIEAMTVTNSKELKGDTIKLLNKFVVDYKSVEYEYEDEAGEEWYSFKSYIAIDPIEPEWSTSEVEIGDELDDYVIDGVVTEPVKTIEITKVTEPITVLDSEVDLNAVDSNLILVGGPVANAITKYLVDQGLSTVDWENSDGEFEYLEDVFGEYDVLIVAGKDRYATREAAKELMQYLAAL